MKTNIMTPAPDAGSKFLDAPDHPQAEILWKYWLGKCRDGRIPDRQDINISDLAEIAPHLIIAEPSDKAGDFRLRLVGSALAEITGEERTGLNLSQIGIFRGAQSDTSRTRWMTVTQQVFATGKPAFLSAAGSLPGKGHLQYHAVSLPLTTGGDTVGQMIGCLFTSYREDPGQTAKG